MSTILTEKAHLVKVIFLEKGKFYTFFTFHIFMVGFSFLPFLTVNIQGKMPGNSRIS